MSWPAEAKTEQERRRALNSRWLMLRSEQSPFRSRWRDLSDYVRPRSFREFESDVNRSNAQPIDKIINSTPLEAQRIQAQGMMSGVTPPSRPWFRLKMRGVDREVAESEDAKTWLSMVEREMRDVLASANVYKGLHILYSDHGTYGFGVMLVDEDEQDLVRAYNFPVGSYVLATSPRGEVDTLIREVSLTVGSVVRLFGKAKVSLSVREKLEKGQFDERITVRHAIFPNPSVYAGAPGPDGMKWLSCWWESNATDEQGFLREGGYHERPFFAPRWSVTGEDTYGVGCGDVVLGDAKALQTLERRGGQVAELIVNPPMAGPREAQSSVVSLLPGRFNFIEMPGGAGLRPAIEPNPQAIGVVEEKIRQHEARIKRGFFADLWLMLQEIDGQMTAREVQERREEKLLQLGAVLEALQDELLEPLIDRLYAILLRRGRIPPPPESIQGLQFEVEYISMMAQAQKLLAVTGLERIATFCGNLATIRAEIMDKLDLDQVVDELADSLGVPPAIIRTDEAVEALRLARTKQQAQMVAAQQAQMGAETAKTLADTQMSQPSALTEMMRGVGVR